MTDGAPPEVEAVMTKLRSSLKRRGAEGIRGLSRHFKASAASAHLTTPHAFRLRHLPRPSPVRAMF